MIDIEKKKQKYFKSKEELDEIRSNMTLLKWQVLSKAYKLGKEIWKSRFTVQQLAKDMDMPYTTVKRCLALDRATAKSWELLRKKKISAFKLAMICQLKSKTFQDDIVDIVIKDNLSTHQIKGLKINNIKDVNNWRQEKAVEKGYSRKDSAYVNFNRWISRGQTFLLMPLSAVGTKREKEILDKLKLLRAKLDRYIKKYDK